MSFSFVNTEPSYARYVRLVLYNQNEVMLKRRYLILQVRSLDIEEKYDILNIYEGTEINEQNLILSLGGQAATQTVRSLSSFLTIQFVSDHSVQGKGFNITWTAGKLYFLFFIQFHMFSHIDRDLHQSCCQQELYVCACFSFPYMFISLKDVS